MDGTRLLRTVKQHGSKPAQVRKANPPNVLHIGVLATEEMFFCCQDTDMRNTCILSANERF
ncbi:hypothetical protein KSD_80220 [Ktedonobacter sp. SOSP1-85]|nr:hypothetical protein KSD_80220 [Ktedonobacter sp. SOSP1-85]